MARFKLLSVLSALGKLPDLVKRSADWDLKGTTLLELINADGISVKPSNAMKFTGVLAAVSLRSELFAAFPKDIFKITKIGREPSAEDSLYKILAFQPNPYMNAFTFWELINSRLDLTGNAYAFITRYNKEVISLTPIATENVIVLVEKGKLIYRVAGTQDNRLDKDHTPDKFLHFKDISYDGLVGLSRITLAKRAIELGLEAENFGLTFFQKGGISKGVIEMDGALGDDAYATFSKRWNENVNHGTPILDQGMKYKQLVIPPEDAQFIESRNFQLQDIARVFRVPPHLLADLSRATFSNIEHSDIQFVKYGLRPMVKRYENELELKLLGDDLGKKVIRFNLDGILRGDTAAQGTWIQVMKQNKILTTNEIRAKINYNPIEGGDVLENPATSSDKSGNKLNNK